MSSYTQIIISNISSEQSSMMVAFLADAGYEGFVEEEKSLTAFIPEKDFDEILLKEILQVHQLSFTKELIAEKNWNEEWEKNFEPVMVDDFCAVRAGFHQPIANVQHEIIITPKMSFGTGHHATTYMMMKSMGAVDFKNKSVLDFGTGTGVLAILAEKLGAKKILAIDNDEWSIKNGKENIEKNHCSSISIELKNNLSGVSEFDIVLANINRNVLLDNMQAISSSVKQNGVALISGFYEEDAEVLLTEAAKFNLRFVEKMERNKWCCIRFAKVYI